MNANKKILSVILALMLCLSTAVIAVSAEETPIKSNNMYKDIVFQSLGDRVNEHYNYRCVYVYNADGATPKEGEMPDYILAHISSCVVHDTVIELVIGDYYFYQGFAHYPFDLGYCIYSTEENKCYSLEAAWNAKLPNTEAVLAMLGTKVKNDDSYKEAVFEALHWDASSDEYIYDFITDYNADGTTPDEGATADYVVAFASINQFSTAEIEEVIGNYRFYSPNIYYPYDLGYMIYSTKEEKCYSLCEAWNANLPCIEIAFESLGTKVSLYAQIFEEYLKPYAEDWDFNTEWHFYDELYYYTAEEGGSGFMPEATPDYVLVKASTYNVSPMDAYEVFGDYMIHGGCGFPYCGNYHIYTPKDGKIYTLREAFDAELEGIMNVFTDYTLGYLLGDADGDRRLTIKDATYIQKCLAKIEGFSLQGEYRGHNLSEADDTSPDPYVCYIEDFDNNDTVNVKDATAIQKRLAKIDK